ncbi:STAS/SEC14 domain-containing protein [Alisedimentitalea sp. MJ-SS2]|uniref:STAS/SEC14 domain-containing protein n=1 Tax=Aliisedimentitalea sp. MJ-SS2 TaxID=3049795 RepID=UPI002910303C|nr:STAS/SEC14 domain-containing protein [Alisedimentitalea sp. MJ-SS2]MDU8929170.1 STAS/SEC14 domain-containing protein [Alisedimentitalea sp. MJ-SS2]
MPTHYEILPDQAYIHVHYQGAITAAEIKDMFNTFRASSDFDPALPHLADLSDMTGTDAGFADFFSVFSLFSRAYAETETGLRCAIFAPDNTTFGLARIFENLTETSNVVVTRLFDDLDDAIAWVCTVDRGA